MSILVSLVLQRIWYATVYRILVFRYYGLVVGIAPMGLVPQTATFTNMCVVDSPDPITRHSDFLHTLPLCVGKRALSGMQNVPIPATHSSPCWPSSVGNCMRSLPLHLPELAASAQRSRSYILRKGSGRTDGREVYCVIRCVPIIMVLGVGTQLPRQPVMTCRPQRRGSRELLF